MAALTSLQTRLRHLQGVFDEIGKMADHASPRWLERHSTYSAVLGCWHT